MGLGKNWVQGSRFKFQGSIGYTPEGANTEGRRLTAAADKAIKEELIAGTSRGYLRRRPISRGGKRVPLGSTDVAGVVEL
jgi:hypothetical protein